MGGLSASLLLRMDQNKSCTGRAITLPRNCGFKRDRYLITNAILLHLMCHMSSYLSTKETDFWTEIN